MKTSDYIVNTINRFPKGFVFTHEEFSKQVESKEAIIKALNRMAVWGRSKKRKRKVLQARRNCIWKIEPPKQQICKGLLKKMEKS